MQILTPSLTFIYIEFKQVYLLSSWTLGKLDAEKRQDVTNDHLIDAKILKSIHTINDNANKGRAMPFSFE